MKFNNKFTTLMKIYFTTKNFTLLRKTLLYYVKRIYTKSIFFNWVY